MRYWSGDLIKELNENEIFVFGSNPEGRHGAGAAKVAVGFGAKRNKGRGLSGNTYALITKNLKEGFIEKETGIHYEKEGYLSVSKEQIKENVKELYQCAIENPDKDFIVSYKYITWPNGSPKKSLNGYTSLEILDIFLSLEVPSNVIFHDSYESIIRNKYRIDSEGEKRVFDIEEIINYDYSNYEFFYTYKYVFSNFYPAKFDYKELSFISNEHFYIYAKAMNFKDDEIANKIMQEVNDSQIANRFKNNEISADDILRDKDLGEQWNKLMMLLKHYGRKVKNLDEEFWNEKKVKVLYFGAKLKFEQNEDLRNMMLSKSLNTVFVEASLKDKFFGIGLYENDARKTLPENWPGQNHMGKILGQVHKYLHNKYINNLEQNKEDNEIEVVNIYKVGKTIPEDGVYIGRANKTLNLTKSFWENPFPMKDNSKEERERVVLNYDTYLWEKIANNEIKKENLLSLRNKKLVCYCAPLSCHGNVIKNAVDLLINNEKEFDLKVEKIKRNKKLKP